MLDALEDRHPDALSVEISSFEKFVSAHRCLKLSVSAVHIDHLLSTGPELAVGDRNCSAIRHCSGLRRHNQDGRRRGMESIEPVPTNLLRRSERG
ncbi:MAG: hypothetical protein Q7J32_14085 [Sphingomonadaceae bacterium]|nr:hypothetical protein [Sphingomonadaceae bacterium]